MEVAKRALDAYNRRDLDDYDELFTPDYELFPGMIGVVHGVTFRGREGLERYAEEMEDAFEEGRLIGEEFCGLGDRVLVVIRVEIRGRGSGVPVTALQTTIFDFRGGKISRMRAYLDHGEALRAAGLAEEKE